MSFEPGRGCFRVLIEERLDGPRLKIQAVFEIVSQQAARAREVIQAIAYVDVNRGVPVRVFSSVAEAERWLLDAKEPTASL